jgi:hypothetical protein
VSKLEDLHARMGMGGPRDYRLDVKLPVSLSAKLSHLKTEFQAKGVRTSKSELVVIILQQFFDSVDEE